MFGAGSGGMGMGDEMGDTMVVEGVSEEEGKNGLWRVE
ncbi:malic enzyme-like NAD(P)-binding protein [Bacillus pumilus]